MTNKFHVNSCFSVCHLIARLFSINCGRLGKDLKPLSTSMSWAPGDTGGGDALWPPPRQRSSFSSEMQKRRSRRRFFFPLCVLK